MNSKKKRCHMITSIDVENYWKKINTPNVKEIK